MTLFTKDALLELSAAQAEPEWMRDARLAAWNAYESLPIPTTNEEAWRRTDLRRFKLDEIGPSLNGSGAGVEIPAYLGEQLTADLTGGSLVIVDSGVTKFELSDELKSQGVIFSDMATAVREHSDLVRRYFMTEAVPASEGKFAALNGAFWRSGTFLYVPRNVAAAAPLHSALFMTGRQTFHHTLVVLEEGAQAVLIDEYTSRAGNEQALHNGVVEIIVGRNASLTYVSLQDFSDNVWQFNHERARIGRDARLDWVSSYMGGRLVKAFQSAELDGQGSWARMSGLFFANGRQHFDLDTQQNHNAPDTVSDLLYKGGLNDRARTVWQGMIKAQKDSQRIDGFQANRNLLLSKAARADSIPGLEIEADDVRCTHASTVGQIDPQHVFYLMSRGIPEHKAVEMVVQGFFAPVMERIPFEGVRDRISARILEKVG